MLDATVNELFIKSVSFLSKSVRRSIYFKTHHIEKQTTQIE